MKKWFKYEGDSVGCLIILIAIGAFLVGMLLIDLAYPGWG